MKTLLRLCILLSLTSVAGCGYAIEEGLEALAGDGGPPRTADQYGAPPIEKPAFSQRPQTTTSGLQWAPTLDWTQGRAPRLYTPGRSIFNTLSMRGMHCQPVPVGMAQAFSGPTGPEGKPIASLGPLELGIATPDGAVGMPDSWDADAIGDRAWRAGASMASRGSSCGPVLFLQLRLGRGPQPVSVLR